MENIVKSLFVPCLLVVHVSRDLRLQLDESSIMQVIAVLYDFVTILHLILGLLSDLNSP